MTSFYVNETATPETYRLPQHDALPISSGTARQPVVAVAAGDPVAAEAAEELVVAAAADEHVSGAGRAGAGPEDRKSTRLNSSHANTSHAVFCLKKKNLLTIA